MVITAAAKEYLVAIYGLAEEGRPVIAARLAERLNVTAPTVHQMLKRLERDDLIAHESGRGITLTERGQPIAEESLRRLQLAERWLVDLLGLDWAEAHGAARAMEGAISAHIAERLEALLGHPNAGRPRSSAPPAAGLVTGLQPLDQAKAGAVVILERIAEEGDHGLELLAYLDRHGLGPSARLTVAAIDHGAQTMTLQRGGDQIVLSSTVAGRLWVRQLSADEIARLHSLPDSECPDEDHAFVAEVVAVHNECPAGHRLGDRFLFGQRTPCGMCADAFAKIYPELDKLRMAEHRGEDLVVPCPEHGNVSFRVRLGGS